MSNVCKPVLCVCEFEWESHCVCVCVCECVCVCVVCVPGQSKGGARYKNIVRMPCNFFFLIMLKKYMKQGKQQPNWRENTRLLATIVFTSLVLHFKPNVSWKLSKWFKLREGKGLQGWQIRKCRRDIYRWIERRREIIWFKKGSETQTCTHTYTLTHTHRHAHTRT